jgi:hypothetical protein
MEEGIRQGNGMQKTKHVFTNQKSYIMEKRYFLSIAVAAALLLPPPLFTNGCKCTVWQ